MEINVILQAISTVGFPICACAALFWLVNKQDTNHKSEINALRDVLQQNTQALTELRAYLEFIKKGAE